MREPQSCSRLSADLHKSGAAKAFEETEGAAIKMMRFSRIQSLAYGTILILLSVSSSVCSGQSISAQDISSWWTNLADAPLQISLSPKKDRLFISNTSDRNARRFRLGCATTLSPVLKIGRKFDWEISDSLQAATEGRYRFETLGDKYNDPNVCKSGKLILLATEFDDGTFFCADSKQELRDIQIAPKGAKIGWWTRDTTFRNASFDVAILPRSFRSYYAKSQ